MTHDEIVRKLRAVSPLRAMDYEAAVDSYSVSLSRSFTRPNLNQEYAERAFAGLVTTVLESLKYKSRGATLTAEDILADSRRAPTWAAATLLFVEENAP